MYSKAFRGAALFSGLALVYAQDLGSLPPCAVSLLRGITMSDNDLTHPSTVRRHHTSLGLDRMLSK